MLAGESLDQFIDTYWEWDRAKEAQDDRFLHPDTKSGEELEEYRLKEDGVIVEPIEGNAVN